MTIKKAVVKKKSTRKPKGKAIKELSLEILNKEIEELRTELKLVKSEHKRFNSNSERALKTAQDTNAKMQVVTMILGGKHLQKAKEDAAEIMERYKVNFLKSIVMSEVVGAYAGRRGNGHRENYTLMLSVIKAYDNTDEWWQSREHLTILQWINTLLKVD